VIVERELRVAADLADEAAKLFCATAADKSKPLIHMALSGGSTPGAMYDLLATRYRDQVDWQRLVLFWGDERCVPPAHPDSNYGQAKARLLDKVPIPPAQVHRFEAELAPEEAARRYDALLRRTPRLDLIFLGMGDDGHTASLFPGTTALSNVKDLAVANPVPQLNTTRLTLTYPALDAAALVAILVGGKGKAARLRQALDSTSEGDSLPVQRVRPRSGRLLWLVDRDAAGLSSV
jgi:6-phosphogluconolactonase